MDRRLRLKDAAVEIGANFKSYESWEAGRYEPEFRFWPGIIRFLGYDPSPEPQTLGERIRAKRRREGLTQQGLALKLGIDPSTVVAREAGEVGKPHLKLTRLFEEYVGGVRGGEGT